MVMAQVELQGITKTHPGKVTALHTCDLKIPDGQMTVLVGPSGSGKSTMLRLIAGLEPPSEGRILIGGQEVNQVRAKDRDVAMVLQEHAVYPHLTVDRNLRYPLERRRRIASWKSWFSRQARRAWHEENASMRERVGAVAAQLDIEDIRDRWPHTLSGGQRQRVALGRALVRDPAVFLLDEPLSHLDAQLRVELRSELKRAQRLLAATMIHVTHDQEEAMAIGDTVVVLRQGVIRQVGTPAQIYHEPADCFVASFVGTPSMNLLPGTMASGAVQVTTHDRVPIDRTYEGSVILGIRPESVQLGTGPYRGTLVADEQVGDRRNITLRAFGEDLRACVDASAPMRVGDVCSFALGDQGLHVFRADADGLRIA